tara:strand:+ start:7851 stop:8705 length:855 start_codon:yes stop_codon:yes gene_type:complete
VPAETGTSFAFSLESEMWKINHERCGLLFGPAAAILQIAHPRIAQGVADHSDFEFDTVGRLRRTLASTNRIAFGTIKDAEHTKERLKSVHQQVQGRTSDTMEGPPSYSAFEPDLLLWVLGTLIMAALQGHELARGPLPADRKDGFYHDMRRFGTYFGLKKDFGPSDFRAFQDYYQEMLSGDLLGSHPLCEKLTHSIVYPEDSLETKVLGQVLAFLPIETLPADLLPRLGLASTRSTRIKFRFLKKLLPSIYTAIPKILRLYPESQERLKREHEPQSFRTSHPTK